MDYDWDGAKWADAVTNVYTYNAQGMPLQVVSSDSVTQVPKERATFTYDAQGRPTQIQGETWSGTAWVNALQLRLTYDAQNDLTSILMYMWMNNAWVLASGNRFTITRNGAGVWQEMITETLQPNGSYINTSRQQYTIVNNRHTEIVNQIWQNNAWVNTTREINIEWADFNAQQYTSYVMQTWVNNAWQNTSRYSFTYPGNGSSVAVMENWSGTAWVNATRSSQLYDAQRSLTNDREETWQGAAWVITSETKYLIKYGDNNRVLRTVEQELTPGTTTFVNVSRTNNSNFQAFSVTANRLALRANQGSLYPNPAADAATLELSGLRETTPLQAEIVNSLGQVVRTQPLQPRQGTIRATLNLQSLAGGVYFIRLRTSEGTVMRHLLHR
ncbi:hypothetical protein PK28_05165 [Hymenobacter sp. DG25B]|uniref:T9SS type A sorting domain-containing protein n=1 Tax=Hymenobacter sp. DG25B TaxID=1385664 RepID=UPI000540C3C4|nr:T9SS type A sorting domain-containing protein [Hymenobacter sp. DG25B]AIZ63228.1 hypothetical protein PK28_05165 [Hymenobacter sp. DG25B]